MIFRMFFVQINELSTTKIIFQKLYLPCDVGIKSWAPWTPWISWPEAKINCGNCELPPNAPPVECWDVFKFDADPTLKFKGEFKPAVDESPDNPWRLASDGKGECCIDTKFCSFWRFTISCTMCTENFM